MAFPTTNVLDNFNRGNGSVQTGDSNWSVPTWSGDSAPQISSNQIAGQSGYTDAYRNNITPTDSENYIDVATRGANGEEMYLDSRIQSPNAAGTDSYQLYILFGASSCTWQVVRLIDGGGGGDTAQLGADITQQISSGDSVGIEVTGNGATVTLKVMYKASGGSWSTLATRTDTHAARITSSGRIGFGCKGTTLRLDNAGGGAVVASTTYDDTLTLDRGVTAAAAHAATRAGVLTLDRGVTAAASLGGTAHEAALSLARGLTAADAGVPTLAAALALSRGLTATDAGALLIGAALALGRVEDATGGPATTRAGALTLDRGVTVSDAALAALVDAIALARGETAAPDSAASLALALTLDRGEGVVTSLTGGVYQEGVSLARGLSIDPASAAVMTLALALARAQAVSEAGTAILDAGLSVERTMTTGPAGGQDADESLTLSAGETLDAGELLTKEEALALVRGLGLAPGEQAALGVALALARGDQAGVAMDASPLDVSLLLSVTLSAVAETLAGAMDLIVRADDWIYRTLTDDATLLALVGNDPARVCADVIPDSVSLPAIVYQMMDSADVAVVGAQRILMDAGYVVKVVGAVESYGELSPIASRIDALLHRQSSGHVESCVRERPVRYTEVDEGKQYRHLGGEYRLQIRGA